MEVARAPDVSKVKEKIKLFELFESKGVINADTSIKRKILKGRRRQPTDNLLQLTISRYLSNFGKGSCSNGVVNLTHTEGPVGGHTYREGKSLTLPRANNELLNTGGSTEKKRKLSGGAAMGEGGGNRPPKLGKMQTKETKGGTRLKNI